LDKSHPAFWLNLGNAVFGQGRWEEAARAFRQSTGLDATNPNAWSNLGVAEQRLSRYPQAHEAYEKSLKLEPNDLTTQTNLGVVLVQLNQPQRAKEVLSAVLQKNERSAAAWAALGAAQKGLGNSSEVISALRRALAIDPNFLPALYHLAVVLELNW